jgi:uracil-DNA glycosylase
MKGFFSKEQTQDKGGQMKGFSCASCGLIQKCPLPKMQPYGIFKKEIMVIGEAPAHEDQKRKTISKQKGAILQRKYKELGINLFEDCISLNAVNCRLQTKKEGTERLQIEKLHVASRKSSGYKEISAKSNHSAGRRPYPVPHRA